MWHNILLRLWNALSSCDRETASHFRLSDDGAHLQMSKRTRAVKEQNYYHIKSAALFSSTREYSGQKYALSCVENLSGRFGGAMSFRILQSIRTHLLIDDAQNDRVVTSLILQTKCALQNVLISNFSVCDWLLFDHAVNWKDYKSLFHFSMTSRCDKTVLQNYTLYW